MVRLLVVFTVWKFWNECAGLNFCEQATNSTVKVAPIQTVLYPSQQFRTNPACTCGFSIASVAEGRLAVIANCPNSDVTFRLYGETKLAAPENKDSLSVRCRNVTPPYLVELIHAASEYKAVSISVDADLSDAYSSFQIHALVVNKNSEFSTTAIINTTCQAPTFVFLNYIEKNIIASSVAGFLAIIIFTVGPYCIWRNRLKLMRLTNKPMQNEEQQRQGDFVEKSENPEQQCQDEFKHENGNPEQQCQDDFKHKCEHPEPTEKSPRLAATYTQSKQKSKRVHVTNQIQSKPKNKDLVDFAISLHEKRKLERGDSLRLSSSAV